MKSLKLSLIWLLLASSSFTFYKNEDFLLHLQDLLSGYNQECPTTEIYIHTDKNIYMPGETIWLKAYLQSTSQFPSEALYIRLVNKDHKAIIEKEFHSVANRANGDIFLPDSLGQGDYILYAYTDKMINFDLHDIFVQKVKIVANTVDQLQATAYVSTTTPIVSGTTVQILCNLTRNKVLLKGCKGTYSIQTPAGEPIANGKLLTDNLGDANITFTYPTISPSESLTFKADFVREGTKAEVVLNLPAQKTKLTCTVFPEGGQLIEGIRNKILVELRDASDHPVSTAMTFKEDNVKILSFQTNKSGRATFYLTPSKGKAYNFHIKRDNDVEIIPLDVPVKLLGWNIELKEVGGKIAMIIRNRGEFPEATLALRTIDRIVWHKSVSVPDKDSLVIPFASIDTAKRLLSYALFDSNKRLSNERLFLTKKTEDIHVNFTLNRPSFGPKQKVIVDFKVTDSKGKPVHGNFSAAVVSQKAMDDSSYKTIQSTGYDHIFAQHNLTAVIDDSQPDFNDALIGHYRLNNTWANIMTYNLKGTVNLIKNSAGLVGFVKSKKNRPIKQVNLVLMSTHGSMIVSIEANGAFMIPAADFMAEEDKKNFLFLNEGFYDKYSIDFKDYASEADSKVSLMGVLSEPVKYITASPKPEEPPMNFVRILKEVKITSNTNEISYAKLQELEAELPADCQDYVCQYGYLNCSIHHIGTKPVIGQVYDINGMAKRYTHCYRCTPPGPSNRIEVKKIDIPREFPIVDYEKEGLSSIQYQSTLFWNPNINTDSIGTGKIQFYTSDLKGTFKIILQGIALNGNKIAVGKKEFNVL